MERRKRPFEGGSHHERHKYNSPNTVFFNFLRFIRFACPAWFLTKSKEVSATETTGHRVLDVNFFFPDANDPDVWARKFRTAAYVLADSDREHVTYVNEHHGHSASAAMHGRQIDKMVLCGFNIDPREGRLLNHHGLRQHRPFDAVVGHFALDRACSAVSSLNSLLRNVSSVLRVGGTFSGVTLDANVVVKSLRQPSSNPEALPRIEREIGPPRGSGAQQVPGPQLIIELQPRRGAAVPDLSFPSSSPPFGYPLRVQFGPARPMTLYVVLPKAVREAAARYGLELILWQNATEHIEALISVITTGAESNRVVEAHPEGTVGDGGGGGGGRLSGGVGATGDGVRTTFDEGVELVDDYTPKLVGYTAERRAAVAQLAQNTLTDAPPTTSAWHGLYTIAVFAFRKVREVAAEETVEDDMKGGDGEGDGDADLGRGGGGGEGVGEVGGDDGAGGDMGDDGDYYDDEMDDM